MIVAVMTQPLRAAYCAEYLHRRSSDSTVVAVVADRRAFAGIDLPADAEVVYPSSAPSVLPSERVSRSHVAGRVRRWMRSGSTGGARAHRLLLAMTWRLRYLDRTAMLVRRRRASAVSSHDVHRVLQLLASREPITELVAFDAFDLPSLLEFGEPRGIPVMLR